MPADSNQQRRAPPLAERPPFATDEDDSIYDDVPPARPRQKLPTQQKPGQSDSMYQAWDSYLQTDNKNDRPQSGVGGIGMGLMAGGVDDSDDEDHTPARRGGAKTTKPAKSSNLNPAQSPQKSNVQDQSKGGPNNVQMLSRPAPAMAAPPANRQNSYERPQQAQGSPPHAPGNQQRSFDQPRQGTGVQRPAAAALRVNVPQPGMPAARGPMPAFMQNSNAPLSSPSLNPHPLNAPSTPITPVFARPSFQSERRVEFAKEAIMRGNSEETLLPRNTAKGEDFWRRFSFVAKEAPKQKTSSWLKSTMGNNRSMKRWTWCISIFLLLAIGAGIGFGWYFTHNKPAALPLAVGGSANESQITTAIAPTPTQAAGPTSRTLVAPLASDAKRSLPTEVIALVEEDIVGASPPQPTKRSELHARYRLRRRTFNDVD
ncbi:hypothetical protein FRC17_006919 [Serendipita sp. 399]|nr:hypothetical protein FRC17_006919 [Serendipita sp. 399]